jgi:hypothetical protein
MATNRRDLVIDLFKGANGPPGDDEFGAGTGSRHGDGPANPTRGACHQDQLSG